MSNKVFETTISDDVAFSVYIAQGFSGNAEIALSIDDKIISILNVEKRRTGNIICRPLKSGSVRIYREKVKEERELPNLNDVISTEKSAGKKEEEEVKKKDN